MRIAKKVISFTILCMWLISAISVFAAGEDELVSVNVYNRMYYGYLKQDPTDPNISVFSSLEHYDNPFQIKGKWENDTFDGRCSIIFKDGKIDEVRYAEKMIDGWVTSKQPDGITKNFKLVNGIPCNNLLTYRKDGRLISKEYIYHGHPLSEWEQAANELNLEKLKDNPYDLYDVPVKIHGIVKGIYADTESTYLLIDVHGVSVLCKYTDPISQPLDKCYTYIPPIGAEIDALAMFQMIMDESPVLYHYKNAIDLNIEDIKKIASEIEIPVFPAIKDKAFAKDKALRETKYCFELIVCYGDKSFQAFNVKQKDYESICRYTNCYWGEELSVKGTVLADRWAGTPSDKHIVLLQELDTGYYYAVVIGPEEIGENFPKEPLHNMIIEISGVFQTNVKFPFFEQADNVYRLACIPRITAQKLSICY